MNTYRKNKTEELIEVLKNAKYEIEILRYNDSIKFVIKDTEKYYGIELTYYIAVITTDIEYKAVKYQIYNALNEYIIDNLKRFTELIRLLNLFTE